MKLAEALLLRADLKKKLASLRERITRNVLLQEGESPKESVEELLAQSNSALNEQADLVRRINATNQTVRLADGRVLSDVLVERDTLMARHSLLNATIDATHKDVDRYSQREIKWVAQADVAALQKQRDDLAVKIRDINIVIQAANWQIDM